MAVTTGPTRQDTYRVTVQVEDMATKKMIALGTFDKMSGGVVSADSSQYRPGGMEPPVSLGGTRTTSNVIISRLYRLVRDHDHVQRLLNGVGRAKMVISKQPLDIEGNADPTHKPIVYRGILERCQTPEVDSESTTAGLIELEMSVDGFPTQ
jgi:hypothetical protein